MLFWTKGKQVNIPVSILIFFQFEKKGLHFIKTVMVLVTYEIKIQLLIGRHPGKSFLFLLMTVLSDYALRYLLFACIITMEMDYPEKNMSYTVIRAPQITRHQSKGIFLTEYFFALRRVLFFFEVLLLKNN